MVYALPVLYALFAWWLSTGVIFYLDALPQRTFRWSMAGATVLMGAAVYGLAIGSDDTSVSSVYLGFSHGLAIWAWLEVGYYMGFMVGPRRDALPLATSGRQRFVQAMQTTLYHEAIALLLAGVIATLSWGMPNKLALWTFVILWIMQLSAKLNVFLGVPNLGEGLLPAHLSFLRHYMTRKPMNLFFPVSIVVPVALTTLMIARAASEQATPVEAAGLTILATLLVLAVAEHWLLVVPVPAERLWRWCLGNRSTETVADVSLVSRRQL